MRRNLGKAQRPTKTGVRGQSPRLLFMNSSLILVLRLFNPGLLIKEAPQVPLGPGVSKATFY